MSLQRKTLAEMLTFTRAGTATYFGSDGLLKTAAANEPRFDYDPVTLQPRGLLVEGSRTNLLLRSEVFSDAVWAKVRATISANVTPAPDGTMTADKLVEDTSNGTHYYEQSVSVVSGATYTFSAFVKASERSRVGILFASAGFGTNTLDVFNLSTGAVAINESTSALIVPAGNGWYRISATRTATSTGASLFQVRLDNGTTTSYLGDGTSGALVWGAQLEAGNFVTSYIPTTTAATTRADDNGLMAGSQFSDWFNAGEGTIVVDADTINLSDSRGFYGFSDGTTGNEHFGYATTGGNVLHEVRSGGVLQGSNTVIGAASPNAVFKTAFAYRVNDTRSATNGTLSTADTSVTLPVGLDRLQIGSRGNGGLRLFGRVRRIRYWPNRLSDALLQEATA